MKGPERTSFLLPLRVPLVYHDPTSCFLRQRQFGALTKRARKSGSQWTRRWRKQDSNPRSLSGLRVRGTSVAVSWVFAAGLGLVTAWARQAREIVFDGRGVTRTTTADRPAPSAPRW